MAFYDLRGEKINIAQFINEYEKDYFVESKSSIPGNKTSAFVESIADRILNEGIRREDIIFIIALQRDLIFNPS